MVTQNNYLAWYQHQLKSIPEVIQRHKDWPVPGVDFIDIMPILKNRQLTDSISRELSEKARSTYKLQNVDPSSIAILAIESRGFLFGPELSNRLNCPLICARKPGKLPGNIISAECDNEYGKSQLSIQTNSVKNKYVFVVDDVIATGNTAQLCKTLIEQDGGTFLSVLGLFNLLYIPRSEEINQLHIQTLFNLPESYKFELLC